MRTPQIITFLGAIVCAAALALLAPGCRTEGCLAGDDPECIVPSPCRALSWTCDDGTATVGIIESADEITSALDALASIGDVRLDNGVVGVVIDALDHPHYLSPTGGSMLDLYTVGSDGDSLIQAFQATGVLPSEAANYTDMRILEGDDFAAVQFRGHLFDRPDVPISTRYEVRPCEPGVRIRTEVVNLEPDPISLSLVDGYYYGGKGQIPFTPSPGAGFEHPSFGLSTLADGITEAPYLVAAAHDEPTNSYATIACNADEVSGFHGDSVAACGLEARVLMPSDYQVFERFIAVGEGSAVSAAADLALEVRRQLHGEPWVRMTGTVTLEGDATGLEDSLRATVLVSEGTLQTVEEELVPWTQGIPDAAGRIDVRVPPDRSYVLAVESFGRVVGRAEVDVAGEDVDFGTVNVRDDGELILEATVDGVEDIVMAFVVPADDATDEDVRAQMFGEFQECAPLLGPPYGGSPACNRALLDGPATVRVPPGNYDVFATVGPFGTLAAAHDVVVSAGSSETLLFEIETLPLQPEGTVTADLHVHGGASFDATIPDETRVLSFLAARLDVIAATDHFVAGDYTDTVEWLGVEDRLAVMPGVEATGMILFDLVEDAEFPQVIGHWNFWPIEYDPTGPYRGTAWDQMALPGELFTRMADAGLDADTGVIQLNHPISYLDFGRDLGWITAIGLDGTEPLPQEFDGSLPSLFHHQPPGADFANSDYDVQEVMNGSDNGWLQAYRAFWFYLLDEGELRAGTANSDSHSLTDNVVGSPRNVVWADTDAIDFDPDVFNEAVREGRSIGTNGPLIQIVAEDGAGGLWTPSLEPIAGSPATLHVVVDAAPWVPVDEVRIVVNGEVVEVLIDELEHPSDPFGTDGTQRLDMVLDLDDLLPASGDAWLVVEAGRALVPNADLDCDGFPDTGDNNGDGTIDWRDVEDLEEAPEESCFSDTGPLADPPPPDDRDSPDHLFYSVIPRGYPYAFTNPLVFDPDGDGYEGVAR